MPATPAPRAAPRRNSPQSTAHSAPRAPAPRAPRGSRLDRGGPRPAFAAPERVTLAEAFARFAGMDLLASVDRDGGTDRDGLAAAAHDAGIRVAPDDTWAAGRNWSNAS